MGVDSFPRVSEYGAKNSLKIDQSGCDGAKSAESPPIGDRLVAWFAIPIRRSENSQTHRQGKKGLGKRRVNNRQCALKQDDPKATNNSLQNNQQQRRDSKPPQPMTTLPKPKCQGQSNSQQTDGGRNQTMAVFVKNIADHFGPWVKEHVVPEGRRPVGHGKARALAGDEAADKKQRKRRTGEDDGESMGPNARVPRAWVRTGC